MISTIPSNGGWKCGYHKPGRGRDISITVTELTDKLFVGDNLMPAYMRTDVADGAMQRMVPSREAIKSLTVKCEALDMPCWVRQFG